MNRDLAFVAAALATWGLGEGMFYFFQPLYLQELGADPVQIGGVLGMVGVIMVATFLPAGVFSDRIGRRPLLWLAWLLGALATLLMALASHLTGFVAGMLVYATTSFVTVPLNSYVTAARGRMSVGRTITLISATFNFGAILGPLIGGWVGEHYGLRANFRLALVCFVISTAFILMLRPQPVEKDDGQTQSGQIKNLLTGRYRSFLLLTFMAMFAMYLPQPLAGNFLQNERGVNLGQIGQLLSARSLGVTALNLSLGQFNARIGFLLGQVGVGLFSLLIWRGLGMPFYLVGYFLMGSYNTSRNLTFPLARTLVQSARMGRAYGLLETANALAMVAAPPLAGMLYTWDPALVYPVSLAAIALAAAANLLFSPVRLSDIKSFENEAA